LYYAARLLSQIQPKQQSLELIYDLRKMVKPLLDEYFKKNQTYPKRLVFLRDGVSEGQFKKVVSHEMNEIRTACQEVSTGYKPGITFVVVAKRHHTRFFPQNRQDEVRIKLSSKNISFLSSIFFFS
jgi:eukaryotic translation initiation factor 2C